MKTEAELRAAFEAFRWYVDGDVEKPGRAHRQDILTQMNVLGGLAAFEWMMDLTQPGNPIAGTLSDIAVMRQGPERN